MRVKFIRSPGVSVDTVRTQNVGYDYGHVVASLRDAGYDFEEVDGESLSDEERKKLESDARGAFMHPFQKTGRKLPRNCFGTNTYPWSDFGTEIPALLLYDDEGRCFDVYPHEEDKHLMTIHEYVDILVLAG